MSKNHITSTDDPQFQKIKNCGNELAEIICNYMAEHQLNIPHGLTVMASATIGVIESTCAAIGEDPRTMLDIYTGGLKEGVENEIKEKGL